MTRNQHFVPQFYLRRFANARKDQFFTNVFDKVSRKRFGANVRDIASETYFYDLATEMQNGHETQVVETGLSKMETAYELLLGNTLDSLDQGFFDKSNRPMLATFVTLSLMRTKAMRNSIVESYEKMGTAMAKRLASMSFKGKKRNIDSLRMVVAPETISNLHVAHMFDMEFIDKISDIICGHIWVIVKNQGIQGFFTSDNPVVLVPNVEGVHHPNTGIASPGIEIHFPLSPSFQLLILERNYFRSFEVHENRLLALGNEFVQGCNIGQVRNCSRQVYSRDTNFFVARQYCTDHPNDCTGQVERWVVG